MAAQAGDATKIARRSDSIYYDTTNVHRRQLCDAIAHLEYDNAKLRELMRDMWEACPADGYYCIYHCEHYDKESESHCKLEDRMRELGVEVTDHDYD